MRICRSCAADESQAPFPTRRAADGCCLECRADALRAARLSVERDKRAKWIASVGRRKVANKLPKPVWTAPLFAALKETRAR